MLEPVIHWRCYYTDDGYYKTRSFFRDGDLHMKVEWNEDGKSYTDSIFFSKFNKYDKWVVYSDDPGYIPLRSGICNTNEGDVPPVNGWGEERGFLLEPLISFHVEFERLQN